jgi:hypothetical protein
MDWVEMALVGLGQVELVPGSQIMADQGFTAGVTCFALGFPNLRTRQDSDLT